MLASEHSFSLRDSQDCEELLLARITNEQTHVPERKQERREMRMQTGPRILIVNGEMKSLYIECFESSS